MNEWTQNEQLTTDEWIYSTEKDGWCWFEDEKPHPHLWNKFTNATSSIGNMLIRATKAGLDKNAIKIPLEIRIPLVSGKQFAPSKPDIITTNGCNYVNTFKSHSLDADSNEFNFWDVNSAYLPEDDRLQQQSVSQFIEFLQRLTANDEDCEWLICWIAHMLQKPEERPNVHPLFRTQHGIGKNVLVEVVLNKLLCKQVVTTNLKEVRGSHSESVASNLLVFVDESKAKGMNVYLELKSLLTTSEIMVNPKHIRPYKQTIYSRFMFADNTEGRAFNIEQEDRRIYIMEYVVHECDQAETQEFVSEFIDWFNAHWDEVHGWLIGYNISDWSPFVCPVTDAKREYLDMCQDPVEGLIEQYIRSGRTTMTERCWDNLIQANGYAENYTYHQLSLNNSFKYQLENAGFKKGRPQGANGKKASGYFLSGLKGKAAYNALMEETGVNVRAVVSESEFTTGYTC